MKKEEVVKTLLDKGLSQEEIDEMDYNTMRSKLKELETKEKEGVNKEVIEDEKEEVKEEVKEEIVPQDTEEKPFKVFELQLGVTEKRIIDFPFGTKRAVVENIGMGDLYAGTKAVDYTDKHLIAQGEKREFKGVNRIMVGAYSRPTLRVSFYE